MTTPKPNPTHPPIQKAVDSKRRMLMPAVVLGLLGGHVLFIMIAITVATSDRSFAVVPDYYQKAVDHSSRQAALLASSELGWVVELKPAGSATAAGQRELVLTLTDHDGEAIRDAVVHVSGYHLARAGEPQAIDMTETTPGRYAGSSAITREGFWWFELSVQHGDTTFVAEFKQFVTAPGVVR